MTSNTTPLAVPFLSAQWSTSSHHKIKIFFFFFCCSCFFSVFLRQDLTTQCAVQPGLALNLIHSPPWPLTSVFPVSDSHLLELQAGCHCAIQSKTFLMLILKEDSMFSCPANPFSENDISLILIISTSPNCLRMWVDLVLKKKNITGEAWVSLMLIWKFSTAARNQQLNKKQCWYLIYWEWPQL